MARPKVEDRKTIKDTQMKVYVTDNQYQWFGAFCDAHGVTKSQLLQIFADKCFIPDCKKLIERALGLKEVSDTVRDKQLRQRERRSGMKLEDEVPGQTDLFDEVKDDDKK